MTRITIGFLLSLLSFAAAADLICDRCAYITQATYIGSYWPGDRGSFVHENIELRIGQNIQFDDYYVFDLNQTAAVSLPISATSGTSFTLTPGRYVIRIAAGTKVTGETSYKGVLSAR